MEMMKHKEDRYSYHIYYMVTFLGSEAWGSHVKVSSLSSRAVNAFLSWAFFLSYLPHSLWSHWEMQITSSFHSLLSLSVPSLLWQGVWVLPKSICHNSVSYNKYHLVSYCCFLFLWQRWRRLPIWPALILCYFSQGTFRSIFLTC